MYAQYSVQDDQHESALVFVNDPVVTPVWFDIPEPALVPIEDPFVVVGVSDSPNPEAMMSPMPLDSANPTSARHRRLRRACIVPVILEAVREDERSFGQRKEEV